MKKILILIMFFVLTFISSDAMAIMYHGVEFPGGVTSFADSIDSFNPPASGSGRPTDPYLNSSAALGVPDYPEGSGIEYVSLGDGGNITFRFVDNSLTGSGNNNLDLWIFEIGPDVEDTYVEISKNNTDWYSVGKVFGSTSGVDIDAYGFTTTDFFSFVRLTDDTNEGDQSGATVGADIDAIGAISSAPPVNYAVPEPATLLLFGTGLAGAFLRKKLKV
jgi:hypothetical protein